MAVLTLDKIHVGEAGEDWFDWDAEWELNVTVNNQPITWTNDAVTDNTLHDVNFQWNVAPFAPATIQAGGQEDNWPLPDDALPSTQAVASFGFFPVDDYAVSASNNDFSYTLYFDYAWS